MCKITLSSLGKRWAGADLEAGRAVYYMALPNFNQGVVKVFSLAKVLLCVNEFFKAVMDVFHC